MKKLFRTKKSVALLAALVVASAAAVGGYAYFTTPGSGTGSASVGTETPVTLHATAGTLYPGTSTTVNFTVDNPSPGHQFVTKIILNSVTTDAAHSGCVMSDFTMPDVNANQDFANGNGQAVTATG